MSAAAGGEPDRVTYRGTVYPWHCDHMGHMNVMWYVGKFDEATWSLMHRLGVTPAYLQGNGRGMVAVDQHLEYKRELHAGDIVTVRSRILELHAKKVRFQHEMVNDGTGEVSAVTTLMGVHLDTQTRRACPFPQDLLARLQSSGW